MITIKKYPNRRLYNTATSTYINLEGIQNLILDGETVVIIDSRTGDNVTTATLLLHALDAEIIEALIPSEWMQSLMRMASNVDRLNAIHPSDLSDEDSESRTQEEKTVPKVATVQPGEMIVSSLMEGDSETSDSDSEVTVVRGDDPPTEPVPVAKRDSFSPIEVQVSMDAWGVSGEVEDSEIPSFWSDTAFEHLSIDEEELQNSDDSSDDGLFNQPETIVVQQREHSAKPTSVQAESQSRYNLGERQMIDDMDTPSLEPFSEDSSEVDSSSDTSESSVSSSSSPPSEHSSDLVEVQSPSVDLVKDSVQTSTNETITPITEAAENGPERVDSTSKSDKMKARLEAMRAKLKR